MPRRTPSPSTVFPILVALAVVVLPAVAQGAVVTAGDAEGCCRVSAGCVELSRSQCGDAGGRFFAGHSCSNGPSRDCVLVHRVTARVDFQLRLFQEGSSPLQGPVSLIGEAEIARTSGSGASPITTEIVSLELSGTPPAFGPIDFGYAETDPPTGDTDLNAGSVDLRLLSPELILHEPTRVDLVFGEPLVLRADGVDAFPPQGSTLSMPVTAPVPLLAGDTAVGEAVDVRLSFPSAEPPVDCPGPAPAATLLVPYFEVDLDDVAGPTTLATVSNGSDEFVLARLLLWTDLGVPTLGYHVYLSPGDVQSLNLRDLLAGRLPDTSAVLADPARPVLDFDPCQPGELAATLSGADAAALRAAHLGAPDPASGLCSGLDRGDAVARGYVTVDTVRRCAFPPTVRSHRHADTLFDRFEYSNRNVLWGDYIYIDSNESSAQSQAMVHRPYEPLEHSAGEYTFYGRYFSPPSSDARDPLPSRYRVRFLQGGPFSGGTRLVVWRDSLSGDVEPRPCGTAAPWQPLGDGGVVVWDEAENAVPVGALSEICPGAGGLSFACDLGGLPFPFGYLELDLAHGDGRAAQAAVVTVLRAGGRYSAASEAVPVDGCGRPAPPAWIEETGEHSLGFCEYTVLGTSGEECPFEFGDKIHILCGTDKRCPLRNGATARPCPGGDCVLPLRLSGPACENRGSVNLYRVVEDCD